MCGNQIIVSAHRPRRISLGCDARLGKKALHSYKVLDLLPSIKCPPGLRQFSSGARSETISNAANGIIASPNYSPFLADNRISAFWFWRSCSVERNGPLQQQQKQQWPAKAPEERY